MDKDFLIFLGTLPWVLFLFVVFFYNNRKGSQDKRLKVLFLFVFIFAAIRYGIGYDYFSYKYIIEGNGYDYELERWEILPRLLAVFSWETHYQVFFIVSSFLTLYPIYYVSRQLSLEPVESFFVYLMFPLFFLDSLGVVRNAVAYSLVFLMFYYINEKRYLYSIVYWLLAIGFHTSAIVAVLIYPLYYLLHGKGINIIFYLISFALSAVIMPLLEIFIPSELLLAKISANVEKDISATGGLFFYVINGLALCNFLFWNKLVAIEKRNKIYLTLINVGICLWNVFLPLDPITAQRLSLFFLLYLVLLVPSYIHIYPRNKKIVRLITNSFFFLLFISSLGLNLYAYYSRGRNMSNIPYQVFFLNPSDALIHIQ